MLRRNGSMIKVIIGVVFFFSGVYFIYLYNDVSGQLKDTERVAERYRREQETLSAQLQVQIEHKRRLEKAFHKESLAHKSKVDDLTMAKDQLKERCDADRQEFMNRLNSLNQQYKMLKSQHQDMESEYGALQDKHNKEMEDHQQMDEQRNQEYMQYKQERELEISNLKDSVANKERELVQLKTDLQTAKTQIQSDVDNMSQAEQLIASLQQQVQSQKNAEAGKDGQIKTLQDELELAKHLMTAKEQQLKTLQGKLDTAKGQGGGNNFGQPAGAKQGLDGFNKQALGGGMDDPMMAGGGMNLGGMNPGGMNQGGMNPGGMNQGGMNLGGMNQGGMNFHDPGLQPGGPGGNMNFQGGGGGGQFGGNMQGANRGGGAPANQIGRFQPNFGNLGSLQEQVYLKGGRNPFNNRDPGKNPIVKAQAVLDNNAPPQDPGLIAKENEQHQILPPRQSEDKDKASPNKPDDTELAKLGPIDPGKLLHEEDNQIAKPVLGGFGADAGDDDNHDDDNNMHPAVQGGDDNRIEHQGAVNLQVQEPMLGNKMDEPREKLLFKPNLGEEQGGGQGPDFVPQLQPQQPQVVVDSAKRGQLQQPQFGDMGDLDNHDIENKDDEKGPIDDANDGVKEAMPVAVKPV